MSIPMQTILVEKNWQGASKMVLNLQLHLFVNSSDSISLQVDSYLIVTQYCLD